MFAMPNASPSTMLSTPNHYSQSVDPLASCEYQLRTCAYNEKFRDLSSSWKPMLVIVQYSMLSEALPPNRWSFSQGALRCLTRQPQ